jgi:hypothetical protein
VGDTRPGALTLGLLLHADVVETPPARTRVEDAWCQVDEAGVVRVLAHTAGWIEAWDGVNGWRNVAEASHSGNVTGMAGAVFARWKSAPEAEWQAEMGVVGMDGGTVWTKDLRYLSNTTTEVSVWWGDPIRFALKYHTHGTMFVGEESELPDSALRVGVLVDPAVLRFSQDGTELLVGGNGALAIAKLAPGPAAIIDRVDEQRASAFSLDDQAVVYSAPDGDRARLAKWDVSSGERLWVTEPLTTEERTWGVQALAYVPAFGVWLGALDDAVVAVRDRDGRPVHWDNPPTLPANQWAGYDQVQDWFRAPAVVTSCGSRHVLVATYGGAMEVWELSRGRARRARGAAGASK